MLHFVDVTFKNNPEILFCTDCVLKIWGILFAWRNFNKWCSRIIQWIVTALNQSENIPDFWMNKNGVNRV